MAELSYESRHIFDLILERVIDIKKAKGFEKPQAFIYWFINIYFNSPQDIIISGGSKDGKVDAFFTTNDGSSVKHHVINAKYTEERGGCQYMSGILITNHSTRPEYSGLRFFHQVLAPTGYFRCCTEKS